MNICFENIDDLAYLQVFHCHRIINKSMICHFDERVSGIKANLNFESMRLDVFPSFFSE
jgi:hypothetical protein